MNLGYARAIFSLYCAYRLRPYHNYLAEGTSQVGRDQMVRILTVPQIRESAEQHLTYLRESVKELEGLLAEAGNTEKASTCQSK